MVVELAPLLVVAVAFVHGNERGHRSGARGALTAHGAPRNSRGRAVRRLRSGPTRIGKRRLHTVKGCAPRDPSAGFARRSASVAKLSPFGRRTRLHAAGCRAESGK